MFCVALLFLPAVFFLISQPQFIIYNNYNKFLTGYETNSRNLILMPLYGLHNKTISEKIGYFYMVFLNACHWLVFLVKSEENINRQKSLCLHCVQHCGMREYKDITRTRGGHFSSFDNVKNRVRHVSFPTHLKNQERKKGERERAESNSGRAS